MQIRKTAVGQSSRYELVFGGKRLSFSVCSNSDLIINYLVNTGGPKIPGATTILYTEAKAIITRLATKNGSPLNLKFETRNSRLKLWAKNQGRKIFDNWLTINESPDLSLLAIAKINPSHLSI